MGASFDGAALDGRVPTLAREGEALLALPHALAGIVEPLHLVPVVSPRPACVHGPPEPAA